MGSHGLHHRADQALVELAFPTVSDQAEPGRRLHVAPHGLAIDVGQPLDRPQAVTAQPQAQDLAYLEHTHLPEHHRRPPGPLTDGGDSTGSETGVGGYPGGPITGDGVVPCSWRNSAHGGPMLLAGDS